MPILLKELFNTVYPWKRHNHMGNMFYSFTTTNGDQYEVDFDKKQLYHFRNDIEREDLEKIASETGLTEDDTIIDITFGKMVGPRGLSRYRIDPTEDYIRVFSTVLDIMKKEISPDQAIMFSAKEPSRVRLYDRMAKKFKRPTDIGYKFGTNKDVFYILTPKKI